jgi:uncharacterized protein (TIGR03435 family)
MMPSAFSGFALACAMLLHSIAIAQDQPLPPKFEVVSVKPTPKERLNRPEDLQGKNNRLVTGGFPVSFLIGWSYQIHHAKIVGLPAWATDWESAYDIEARAAASVSQGQCRLLARTLLSDRFALVAHRETRKSKGYTLVTLDHGARLAKLVAAGEFVARINDQILADGPDEGGLSMSRLAEMLGGHPALGFVPVIDRTGLPGRYGFRLTFSARDGDDRSSIFTALRDQLGLKLQPTELPVEFLIIDRIEKADAN